MEHQVLVPLPVRLVRQALRDPGLPARCVPGLMVDGPAAGGRVTGRLRLRVGGVTITYRGEFTAAPDDGGVLSVVAEGREARGGGEASAALLFTAEEERPGAPTTLLTVRGDLAVKGRLLELDAPAVAVAGQRLLERFAAALAADPAATDQADQVEQPEPLGDAADTVDAVEVAEAMEELEEELRSAEAGELDAFPELGPLDALDDVDLPGVDLPDAELPDAELPEAELPGVSGEPDPAETVDADLSALDAARMLDGELGDGAPADASDLLDGPVRRSIVGRSAEEVDHAPPRGRYAPALPARSARARAAARWTGAERGPATPVATPDAERNLMPWVIGGGVALLGGAAVALARALRRH
ncbi:hypothetical protein ACIQGZ_00600 [Streptomyces sp. NPDC092296]|uniref:hypothetical protein n=1 Tax=Streptomyces sp. NPDC092296 TaxID=3366012 RepID=UPI003805D176